VPGPAQFADILYMVFVPPGFTQIDYNDGGTCNSNCGSTYNGRPYNMAWVNGDVAGMTHEMAESIAGNVGVTNCTYNSNGAIANQIADICGCYSEAQLGGQYAAYWSQADGQCVIPEGWLNVYQYNGSPNNWTEIKSGAVRQIYAGGYGLVATDTNDNLDLYSGTPLNWTQIGGPGSMFGVGSGGLTVVGLTPDTSAVWVYNGSGEGWTKIGGGASSVYEGEYVLATDYGGNPWRFNVSSGAWAEIGGASDQFAVNTSGVVALSLNHQGVWTNATGASGGWSQIGNAASELFLGVGKDIAVTALAASKDVSYEIGPNNWVHQGAPGNMFAISSAGQLFGLNPNRSAVFQSTNTNVSNPPWTQVGGSASRLVGHGNKLYATGGIQY
jgi:hypothetical protein